jgi:hypothetical protein
LILFGKEGFYMDLTNKQVHFIGYFSSAPESLNRADAIIALAEKNDEEANTLAACATILLAAALEQGVQTVLTEAGELTAFDEDINVKSTKHEPFYDQSIWWRIQSLPTLLSGEKYRLDFNHTYTKVLRELISTRNKLVHVKETAVHLIGPSNQVRVEEDHVVARFYAPKNPWGSVTLEKVKRFREAVGIYFHEVIFPDSGQIREGTIIIAAS